MEGDAHRRGPAGSVLGGLGGPSNLRQTAYVNQVGMAVLTAIRLRVKYLRIQHRPTLCRRPPLVGQCCSWPADQEWWCTGRFLDPEPDTPNQLIAYLSECLPGVGPVIAKRLCEALGKDHVLSVLNNGTLDPDQQRPKNWQAQRLRWLKGCGVVGAAKAEKMCADWDASAPTRDAEALLKQSGFTPLQSVQVSPTYADFRCTFLPLPLSHSHGLLVQLTPGFDGFGCPASSALLSWL